MRDELGKLWRTHNEASELWLKHCNAGLRLRCDMASGFSQDVEFQKLLAQNDRLDLARLMLEFARDVYAALEFDEWMAELERLGEAARDCVESCPPTLPARLGAISQVLYVREGFRGNTDA